MQTVHVRVNDAAAGKPTPCRVRFTDGQGRYHAPLGRLSEFPHDLCAFAGGNVHDGQENWAYIDGACEIRLPPGPINVRIRKGFEYVPIETTVELVPGKLAIRFTLERWTNWRGQGWYAGDSRVHFGSPHEALLQGAGEDLAVVNLLAEETRSAGPLIPNIVAFSGQHPCLEMPGHMVVVNTHNVHAELGCLGLLNCHRVVYPLRVEPGSEEEWTLADWCAQCHRKQGLVVWTDVDKQGEPLMTEALADLVLGKIDAWEIAGPRRAQCSAWFTLLDAGFRLPLAGGSGSRTNGQVFGCPRTYCQLPAGEPLTYRNWIEAVRAGRTFVTQGPLIKLTVNGCGPGGVMDGSGQRVTVDVEASSPIPFEALEVLHNSAVLARQAGPDGREFPWRAHLTSEVSVTEGGWIVAECRGPGSRLLARTSPVYVDGPQPVHRKGALEHLTGVLGKLQAQAQATPRKERLLHVLQDAADVLAGK